MASSRVRPEPPLIVIVGPTASGKTGLSIRLAKEFGGEIISADSRAIYRGLDIGTAKPTVEERQGIVHWGIDIAEPGERFTAANFKRYAEEKIADVRKRGNVPILVGGTGLYIDAIIFDFVFPEGGNDEVARASYEQKSLEWLHEYCLKNNIKLPENKMNKRYVINTILRSGDVQKRREPPLDNCIIVGITTEKNILRERIHVRAQEIFTQPIIEEAVRAGQRYGWDNEAMTGNIYPLVKAMIDGVMTEAEAIQRFEVLDWRLAKRQLTWLKRNEHIRWLNLENTYTYLAQYLGALNKS